MSIFKRVMLVVGVASAFLVGYMSTANAWPVYGRQEFRGYFKNVYDNWGDDVWNGGIPTTVNSANEFITYVKNKLDDGPNTQNGVGAAFIIQTMIGTSRTLPPSAAQVAEWESRVRYADSRGWVDWNRTVSYRLTSYYQGPCSGANCNTAGVDPRDDAFYEEPTTQSASAIVFTNGTNIVYQLRHKCANPIGVVSPLADAPDYTLTGSSTVSDTTVIPGQTVTFTHRLTNSGPDSAPNTRWTAYHNGATRASGGPFTLPQGTRTVNTNNFTVPNNALPNTTYCQYVHYSPKNENGGSGDSTQACARVIADFELTPTVTASATSAQQNDTVTFTYRVFNPGPTPSTSTTCKVVGNRFTSGHTPLPQQDVDRNSDAGFTAPGTSCPQNFFVNTTTTVATENFDIGNATPGTTICRSLVINPKNESGGFRASAEACVVVAKTPYVQMLGNDVWAGGGFASVNPACNTSAKITTSSHQLRDGSVAGSLGEYGAFALGKITTFGSASKALLNGGAATGKMLTFSNTNNNNLGFYAAPQHCINDYVAAYNGTAITNEPGTIDVGGRATGTWQVNGNRTFHGTMPNGSRQIYLVNGDVTIDGDLKYSDNYGNIDQIPSLVIIATGSILVRDNVKQMDGLFVARNTFNTCSNAPGGNLSVNDCKEQLVVNGAVITGQLTLMRTFGADGNNDGDRKRPAEIFNFNPEMYLRSALTGSGSGSLRTVDQKDLPPRY